MPKRRAPVALALPGLEAALAPAVRPVSPAAKAMTLRSGRGSATARGKRCGVAPAPKPWEAVLCVVDTAKVSGWAIGVRGVLHEYGQHDTEQFPARTRLVVINAIALAKKHQLPVVLVLEAPYGGAKHAGMVPILIALGRVKERWISAWTDEGEAKARIVNVEPRNWRGPVLGGWAMRAKRHEVRPAELAMAKGMTRDEGIGPDAAAAVCIHYWAAYAPQVGAKLGKRATRASLKAWQGGAR